MYTDEGGIGKERGNRGALLQVRLVLPTAVTWLMRTT